MKAAGNFIFFIAVAFGVMFGLGAGVDGWDGDKENVLIDIGGLAICAVIGSVAFLGRSIAIKLEGRNRASETIPTVTELFHQSALVTASNSGWVIGPTPGITADPGEPTGHRRGSEVVIGYKMFSFGVDTLRLVGGRGHVWETGTFEAVCDKAHSDRYSCLAHLSRNECECGVYSYRERARALADTKTTDVVGEVVNWGWYIPASNGFRAANAEITRLWLMTDGVWEFAEETAKALGEKYGVPCEVEVKNSGMTTYPEWLASNGLNQPTLGTGGNSLSAQAVLANLVASPYRPFCFHSPGAQCRNCGCTA